MPAPQTGGRPPAPVRPSGRALWPSVNNRAYLWVPGRAEPIPVRVDDHLAEDLLAAALDVSPDPAQRVDAGYGDHVTVTWTAGNGILGRAGRIAHFARRPVPLWRVRGEGPVVREQRRSFVRAPLATSLEVSIDGFIAPATVLDLSEGGMRCLFRRETPIVRDSVVDITLELGGVRLALLAGVARLVWRSGSRLEAGLRFVGLTDRQADRIRGHVFALQVRSGSMRPL